MSCCIYNSTFDLRTFCALSFFQPCFGTGWSFRFFPVPPAMFGYRYAFTFQYRRTFCALSFSPASVQLASFVTVHSPLASCPVAFIARVSLFWQFLHSRVSTPSAVQVAAVVIVQSLQLCPVAGMLAVTLCLHTLQVPDLLPASVQVGAFVSFQFST